MAIAATAGGSGSTTVAAASKALSSFNITSGRDIYCAVALDSTASSVSSITNSLGSDTWSLVAAKNGTGIRVELWKCHVTGNQTSNVITINVSPNCNIAGAAEEYSGVNSAGNTASDAVASDANIRIGVATQDGNNFVVGALGFACVSGDTLTALLGTSRQSSIPAATAAAAALYDNTQLADGTVRDMTRISTARNWAAVGLELRSGGAAITVVDYAATSAPSLQVAQDFRYLQVRMPMGGGGGVLPPSGDGQIFPPAVPHN